MTRRGRIGAGIVWGLMATLGTSTGQSGTSDAAQVNALLRRYDVLVKALDAPGIAALFTVDGEIQHADDAPTRGRVAIERLLAGFSNYVILKNSTVPKSTVVNGTTAVQTGTYTQTVKAPDGALLNVTGSFQADWIKVAPNRWLIKRMATRSL